VINVNILLTISKHNHQTRSQESVKWLQMANTLIVTQILSTNSSRRNLFEDFGAERVNLSYSSLLLVLFISLFILTLVTLKCDFSFSL